MNGHTCKSLRQEANIACVDKQISKTFLLVYMKNVLAEHEMFEKFGGGETSKQGQAVSTISRQANNVGQFFARP